jgi:hypothetical protein
MRGVRQRGEEKDRKKVKMTETCGE